MRWSLPWVPWILSLLLVSFMGVVTVLLWSRQIKGSAATAQAAAWALGGVAQLCLGLFCAYGFMASFEYAGVDGWKIGYGLGVVFLPSLGVICLVRALRRAF